MTAFTVRVADETVSKLDALAHKLDRSRAYIAAQAIEQYVAREDWQLQEIEAGLAEAEAGQFASTADVGRVLNTYMGA